jgi:exosortase
LEDKVPLGTAGCLKMCEPRLRGGTFFVSGGAVWLDDDPEWLLAEHRRSGNALTVFCTKDPYSPKTAGFDHLRPAGIYCCETAILEHIQGHRFQDIKEQLVPALQRAGLRVGCVRLRGNTTEVCDWSTYLDLIARTLRALPQADLPYRQLKECVWCAQDVEIAPTAHLVGPLLIGRGARIGEHATAIGPSVIGEFCEVESHARLIRSVVPDRSRLPAGLYADEVTPRLMASGEPAPAHAAGAHGDRPLASARRAAGRSSGATVVKAAMAAGFLWAFAPTVGSLLDVLRSSADYGAGLLVPFAALYMLYSTRRKFRGLRPAFWAGGIPVFLLGAALNLFGDLFRYSFFENVGLVLAANGLVASLLGRQLYRRAIFPLLFLGLMIPLPHRAHEIVMQPLQGVVAQVSASVLEIAGVATERYGHVLEVGGERVAVAEACNGLRLALAFVIVTAVVAYTARRPVWQKAAVLLSCLPIALACNILRVCGSAYLHYQGFDELAQGAFHDGAGLVMMPFALLMVYFEFWLLSHLVDAPATKAPPSAPAYPALAPAAT